MASPCCTTGVHTEPSPTDPRAIRGGRLGLAVSVLTWVTWLAVVGLVVLGRLDRAPGSLLTGLLFVLPHLWVAHGVGVFTAWCVLPDRLTFPVVLGLSFVGGLGLWGPGLASWGVDGDDTVRVLSWNIQRLWGGPGEEGAPACVADVLLREDPDVVALMEVSENNLEQLASVGLSCVHTTYTSTEGKQRGGLAVCGRNGWTVRGSGDRYVDPEDWSYLAAEVTDGERVFNVLAVHLLPHHLGASATATERVAARQANQSRALLERVERFVDPTVVAGDFNSTRDFHLHAALRGLLTDTWEAGGIGFGATKYVENWLPLRIDFIYASDAFEVARTTLPSGACSDHGAVQTELILTSAR